LGVSPDSIFIMPNASDLKLEAQDYALRRELSQKKEFHKKRIILFVGRLIKRKGISYLIDAFHDLNKERNDVILIIIGKGELKNELQLQCKKIGLETNVIFMDYVENNLLIAYYLLCDVCVVPSITYDMADPWVFVLNEAMMCGKPVISTDAVGGAFDLIKNGINGYVVPEQDAKTLYIAIKNIIADPLLARTMGKESTKIIQHGYSYDHMTHEFMNAVNYVFKKNN